MKGPVLQSELTCPKFGHVKRETMPQDACQFFYECENCNELLRPPRAIAACSARCSARAAPALH